MEHRLLLRLGEARADLRHRSELKANGFGARRLATEIAQGTLLRIRPGWFVWSSRWSELDTAERHLRRIVATAASDQQMKKPSVFSHLSAAILHELPVFRLRENRVHVTRPVGQRRTSTAQVMQHTSVLESSDILGFDGLRMTSMGRTVIDLARAEPAHVALGAADAALRRVGKSVEEKLQFQTDLLSTLDERDWGNGASRARRVIAAADWTAESVLESVSRWYLTELGFEVLTQVNVPNQWGGHYRVDFEFLGLNVLGEVDGLVKYRDTALLDGRSATEIVVAEKQREDYIRGVTGKRIVRWGFAHLRSAEDLASRLRSFGVFPPHARKRLV